MREMDYKKGNMKRVHHLPLDGFTDSIFDELDFLECEELLDFQTQIRVEDDDCCSSSSLPFWMNKSTSNSITYDQDRRNQQSFMFQEYSKEEKFNCKKIIKQNPDSSYELSFRYIIDDDLPSFESVEDSCIITTERERERDSMIKPKGNHNKVQELKKNLSRGGGQLQRMNNITEAFQLKMYIPGSLRLKPKSRNPRKSSSRTKSF